ncbi:15943_t:CDS:1, partial [Racocetra fulgida]
VLRNSTYPLISLSSNNPWQEIRQYCNLEANNNNNKYEISTINQTHTNDNNIEYLNAEVSTINQTHEIYEISSDTEDT